MGVPWRFTRGTDAAGGSARADADITEGDVDCKDLDEAFAKWRDGMADDISTAFSSVQLSVK